MENISDIRIEGIDENRPPSMEYKTYINLFFKLNHQAPNLWCEEFNALMSKHPSKPKIDVEEGMYIETWVKSPGEIATQLDLLKQAVTTATEQYIELIRQSTQAPDMDELTEAGLNSPQGKLNKMIEGLNFDA
jgi:hypothetical protein